jgi:uncharacterized protein YprB with RNaseH-like and TPR domain
MSNDDPHQRLARLERLRKLGVKRGARDLIRPSAPTPDRAVGPLPGASVDTPFGPAWVRSVRYSLAERPDLAALLDIGGEAFAALGRDPVLAALDPARTAFVDTETTGLSPDAGTYTFLIGVGTYEIVDPSGLRDPKGLAFELDPSGLGDPKGLGAFVVHQFFMRSPAEERAQIHLVEEALSHCAGLVSFNGRAFDLPLIQMRFTLARIPPPLPGAPHLDLLPPARRLYRARLDSCRLGSLEQHVLGAQRTEEDVPSWLIPRIYRDYYQHGIGPDLMARVFYHNLMDIVSMPLLAARMAKLFQPPDPTPHLVNLHPLECISLARCYEALGWATAGESAYRAALAGSLPTTDHGQALRDLSFLLKRLERRAEAAALWEEWISSAPADLTPYIELAKHHEWHTGDLAAARGWTAWALRIAESWPPGPGRAETLAELRHRLERVERKI